MYRPTCLFNCVGLYRKCMHGMYTRMYVAYVYLYICIYVLTYVFEV